VNTRSIAPLGVVLLLVIAAPADPAAGSSPVYKARCSSCHAADGSGNTPMGKKAGAKDLASDEIQKQSDAELAKIISDGKGKMPAYGAKLTSDEIGALVKFIRAMAVN
jgi:mono/diheme cytochrome c family protein